MGSRQQKVLHFIESAGVYGAERVILNLSEEMQLSGEFIPVVGCIVGSKEEQSDLYDAALEQKIDAVRLVIPNSRLATALPKAASRLKGLDIKLIHSHGYKPSVFGFIIRLFSGIPVMTTCHLWFEPAKAPLKTKVMLKLESLFYRWFPKVVAVSDSIKETLIKNGIPSAKIEVLKNGVRVTKAELSNEDKTALREQLGIGADSFCILNAGRLARQKAQWTLIEAAALLKSKGIDFRVLIVGEGDFRKELEEKVELYNLQQHVCLLGFRSDMPELLAIANAFALPSLDEGMPMSLLEAAAAEVPVVTTAVGDIPKLIEHENTGLIVPKEDAEALAFALERLHSDTHLSESLALRAKAILEQEYSSAAMAEKYHRIYRELLVTEQA